MADNVKNTLTTLSAVNNLGFVPFTTGLINGVFNSIVSSSISQMRGYAELVTSVSKTLDEFLVDELGADRPAAIAAAIKNGFGVNVPPGTGVNTDVQLTDSQFADMKATFSGLRVNNKGFENTATIAAAASKIKLKDLNDFVSQKLEKDAGDKFEYLKTLLKLGMQKVVVDRGLIRTKLTFSVSAFERESASRSGLEVRNESSLNAAAGLGASKSELSNIIGTAVAVNQKSALSVNVINERSSAASNVSASIIGEVVIEFRTDSFPIANT
jgi:hypothetical protein